MHPRRATSAAATWRLVRPLVARRVEAWAVFVCRAVFPRVCGWCEAVADGAEACF